MNAARLQSPLMVVALLALFAPIGGGCALFLDPNDIGPQCDDLVKNGDETDTDCGGACGPCAAGRGCQVGTDCTTGACGDGTCVLESCTDRAINGDETDVDCGGACASCGENQRCLGDDDCDPGFCSGGVCRAPSCTDQRRNGGEGDVDCGGGCGTLCGLGQGCNVNVDCLTGVCLDSACTAQGCTDGLKNGDETAVDCGGGGCPTCVIGLACGSDQHCQSGNCDADGFCAAASCSDLIKNGDEVDTDCGGPCLACGDQATCLDDADCRSGFCDLSTSPRRCQPPTCTDEIQNGDEADLDCGGSCNPCTAGRDCVDDDDCDSAVCGVSGCAAPVCTDRVKNGGESDVDCGGDCPDCVTGDDCRANADCDSAHCLAGRCLDTSCEDRVKNPGEADVDCGGVCGAACANGRTCLDDDADCVDGFCDVSETPSTCRAPSCSDDALNGDESDVDCGGGCRDCVVGQDCVANADCDSGVCGNTVCAAPQCTDDVKNGGESDVDCGGACGSCPEPATCNSAADCASGVCDGLCQVPTCGDTVQNGAETDVDCGRVCPGSRCGDGEGCLENADCDANACQRGVCVNEACRDDVQNAGESDVDCGGACGDCADGGLCAGDQDCGSGVCEPVAGGARCQVATCIDEVKNGDESSSDCGGSCPACGDRETCGAAADCASGVCTATLCAPPACNDRVTNGRESAVDCGGDTCAGCADGGRCGVDADCASNVCAGNICAAPRCADDVKNGGESDVDCGGPCLPCGTGERCGGGGDCDSGVCASGDPFALCVASTCDDGARGVGETDVDCGGPCGDCFWGRVCRVDGDCAATGSCQRGRCEPDPTATWTNQTPALPGDQGPKVNFAQVTFDPVLGETLLFGGDDGAGVSRAELFTWDGARWLLRETTDPPPGTGAGAFVYDTLRGRSILLLGNEAGVGPIKGARALDAATLRWTILDDTECCMTRLGAAYDARRDVVVAFAPEGIDEQHRELALGDNKWAGPPTSPTSTTPPPRRRTPVAYDAVREVVVLFGGELPGEPSTNAADTWEFDGSSWSLLTPPRSPPARSFHQLTFIPRTGIDGAPSGRVLLSGGSGDAGQRFDSWEWDGRRWLETGRAPFQAASGSSAAYDTRRNVVVRFAGSDIFTTGNSTDEYAVNGVPCLADGACASGSCVDGLCCNNDCTGVSSTCASLAAPGICSADTCSNGRRDVDAGEGGVDCGGPCAACP